MVRILIADDHAVVRAGLRALLEQHEGFRVVAEAANGEEAIAKAQEYHPDVAVLDIRMPGLNGFETIERLREIPEIADTPVVVLSAWATSQHTARAKALGVEWYITKPFNLDDLVNTVMDAYASRS